MLGLRARRAPRDTALGGANIYGGGLGTARPRARGMALN